MAGRQRSSLEEFRLKKLLESLAAKEGRGTELITLYIPPGRQLSEVMSMLREEYGTAANIKSRTTRHNVQSALEKVMQRLKLFKETPPNGLAIFCGAIPRGPPGSEKLEIYVISPPEPLNIYLYRCDSRFHLEPLFEMLKEKGSYGILVMDGEEATFAILRGKRLEVVKSITSGISGRHKKGGQSARRFERLREVEVNEYYKRVADYASKIFLEVPDLEGIIVGGPGPTKEDFLKGEYLHYMLRNKVVGVVDTSYADEQGVKEVVFKAPEVLKEVRYVRERELVQRFLSELGRDTGLAAYGEAEVRAALLEGAVKTLLLSEGLDVIKVRVECGACKNSSEALMRRHELMRFEQELLSRECEKCKARALSVAEARDLIEDLAELAEIGGAEVEVISTSHEEGVMLKEAFGGVAAILKYRR